VNQWQRFKKIKATMKYYSLNHNALKVSFKKALIQGLAPDKGLYFPETITPLSSDFLIL
jgi:threonine synthase